MYDAVGRSGAMAQGGQNRKKAIVLISDGNDTNSRLDVSEVRQLVRETEVLVYAVGIDGQGEPTILGRPRRRSCDRRRRFRFRCRAGRPAAGLPFPIPTPRARGGSGGGIASGGDDRVNVVALREITDDSGGRTEIVRDPRDLDPATASIADELSKQYYLGYPSPGHRDGRWHTIRVEVRDRSLKVRARRGYVATTVDSGQRCRLRDSATPSVNSHSNSHIDNAQLHRLSLAAHAADICVGTRVAVTTCVSPASDVKECSSW